MAALNIQLTNFWKTKTQLSLACTDGIGKQLSPGFASSLLRLLLIGGIYYVTQKKYQGGISGNPAGL